MAAPKNKWPILKARYLERLKVQGYAPRTSGQRGDSLRSFLEYLEKETKTQDLAQLSRKISRPTRRGCATRPRRAASLCA